MDRVVALVLALSLRAPMALAEDVEVKSFYDYGFAVSLSLGAGGALWDQVWGQDACPWFTCTAKPNVGFLNCNSVSLLETTTAGAPAIDSDVILRFTFGGTWTLLSQDDKDPKQLAGHMTGDVQGTFVADLNASRAVVDEAAGTITVVFGSSLHSDPDALITITETGGKFKSIHPIGLWEYRASGTITVKRVPALPLQANILAALAPNSPLLLGAQEELVLSGTYYRSSPQK